MHRFTVFFLLALTLQSHAQTNCESYSDNYIPTDLNDAINFLNCVWSDTSKVDFKNKPENDAVTELHFGTGRSIRNNWGLWSQKSSLYRFFKSKGIFHPDDMSSIILTSFHRTLNEKEIQLDQQIAEYIAYWDNVKIEVEKQREIDREAYNQFKVGDTVIMNFTVGAVNITNEDDPHAFLEPMGKEVEINQDRNCVIEGVIKKKKGNIAGAFYFQIEVSNICNYEYNLAYQSTVSRKKSGKPGKPLRGKALRRLLDEEDEIRFLKVGDSFDYNMSFHNIEKKETIANKR